MMSNKTGLVFGAIILLSLSSIAAHAQGCTDSVLSGGYSFQIVGFTGTEAPFVPFVAQRLVTFDGKGNLSGKGYRVVAGSMAVSPVAGTYSVQSDCSINFNVNSLRDDGSVIHVDQYFAVITEAGLKVQGVLINSTAPATLAAQFEKILH